MTVPAVALFDREAFRKPPARLLFTLSVCFHLLVLIVIPLLGRLLQQRKQFERPRTFQLVASPLRPAPTPKIPVPQEARQQRKPQEEKQAQPRQLPDQAAPRKRKEAQKSQEAARPIRENLDELSSLLDEIPAPAQVAAVGNFKYHWYLNIVQQRLETHWNPTTENRNIRVVVSFTIHQDGTINEPTIASSSGNSTLDNLALRAVKNAAPFPKLPPGFDGNQLILNCTLIPTRK